MNKTLTPKLVKKFDIANKIFKEVADFDSRYILFTIMDNPKNIQEISHELKIPLSTVYKKIKDLMDVSLISVQSDFLEGGRIVHVYQSNIKNVQIHLDKFEPIISLTQKPKIKL